MSGRVVMGFVMVLAAGVCSALPQASSTMQQRLGQARRIAYDEKLAPEERLARLLKMLRRELDEPVDKPGVPAVGELAATERLRYAYVYFIARACGAKLIWQEIGRLSKAAREDKTAKELCKYLLVAMSNRAEVRAPASGSELAKARETAIERLKDALLNDSYDFLRSLAAEALGRLGAEEAIPVLQKALSDPVRRVRAQGCVQGPGREVFLVRRNAALALRRLGLRVTTDGCGRYWVAE